MNKPEQESESTSSRPLLKDEEILGILAGNIAEYLRTVMKSKEAVLQAAQTLDDVFLFPVPPTREKDNGLLPLIKTLLDFIRRLGFGKLPDGHPLRSAFSGEDIENTIVLISLEARLEGVESSMEMNPLFTDQEWADARSRLKIFPQKSKPPSIFSRKK